MHPSGKGKDTNHRMYTKCFSIYIVCSPFDKQHLDHVVHPTQRIHTIKIHIIDKKHKKVSKR